MELLWVIFLKTSSHEYFYEYLDVSSINSLFIATSSLYKTWDKGSLEIRPEVDSSNISDVGSSRILLDVYSSSLLSNILLVEAFSRILLNEAPLMFPKDVTSLSTPLEDDSLNDHSFIDILLSKESIGVRFYYFFKTFSW